MDTNLLIALAVAAVITLLVFQSAIKSRRHEVVAWEWDHTALFVDGRFVRWLPAGRHVLWGRAVRTETVPKRTQSVTVPMQEILTADGASVRISLSAAYVISAPERYLLERTNALSELYDGLQMALRGVVAERTLESVAASRNDLGAATLALVRERAAVFGVEVERLEIRDVAILGEMRRAVAGVLQAKLEGQAALEKARSETAALRSLANAARMMDENPNLLNLRLLQTIEGNRQASVVFDPRPAPARGADTTPVRVAE